MIVQRACNLILLIALLSVLLTVLYPSGHAQAYFHYSRKIDPILARKISCSPNKNIYIIIVLKNQPQYEISKTVKRKYLKELNKLTIPMRRLNATSLKLLHQIADEALEGKLSMADVEKATTKITGISLERVHETFLKIEPILNKVRKEIYWRTRALIEEEQELVAEAIRKCSGKILYKFTVINAISAILPGNKIPEIARLEVIKKIYWDAPLRLFLDHSVKAINAPIFWENGYRGEGIEVEVIDTGIDKNHPALRGKVVAEKSFWSNSTDDKYNHGTHVAGIICSTDDLYRGVAPAALLVNAKIFDAENRTSALLAAAEWGAVLLNDTVEVINTSLGSRITADGQSPVSIFADSLIYNYDVIWVTAAGNEGPHSYSISVPGDAYNIITVGAVDDKDTDQRYDDEVAYFSSRGPTSDGRIKPDVVAPGVNIVSCSARWDSGGAAFFAASGTSMATPHVAGASALLAEYFIATRGFYSPLYVKAVLAYSADPMKYSKPSNTVGFGYINLASAWALKDVAVSYLVNKSTPLLFRASFVKGQRTLMLVFWPRVCEQYTDINVKMFNVYTGELIYESSNIRDNFELIDITTNESTMYLIEIINDNGVGDQVPLVIFTSLELKEASIPGVSLLPYVENITMTDSESKVVKFGIRNTGSYPVFNVTIDVHTSSSFINIVNIGHGNFPKLNPKETLNFSLFIQPVDIGEASINITCMYHFLDLSFTYSKTVTVSVVDDDTKPPEIKVLEVQTPSVLEILLLGKKFMVKFKVTDESGVAEVYVRYKISKGEYSDWLICKKISENIYVFEISASTLKSHLGEKVYIQFRAIDMDNDRPGDNLEVTSQEYSFQLSTLSYEYLILASIIVVIALIVALRRLRR